MLKVTLVDFFGNFGILFKSNFIALIRLKDY